MSGLVDRLNQRHKDFKKGVSADESRRKREDATVQLRKTAREAALQKRRQVESSKVGVVGFDGSSAGFPWQSGASASFDPNANLQPASSSVIPVEEISQMAAMLLSPDAYQQFQAAQNFRKLVSMQKNPPIQEVIDAGVVPIFVRFLTLADHEELQFEAAWVLTNVASGTGPQTTCVVEAGALPHFIQLLASPNDDVREQAVWAVGNIAGESSNYRDLVLANHGLHPVMHILQTSTQRGIMRNATWTLSNLCRGSKPPPPFHTITAALPLLNQLIQNCDEEVLIDACWALSFLSDGPEGEPDQITAVIQAGVVPRLVELLGYPQHKVQTPALRAIGNIAAGNDEQTQYILDAGALPHLAKLLSHQKQPIAKEACWTISNITAGSVWQIRMVIEGSDQVIIPAILHMLSTAEFEVKKEACWVISNAVTGGTASQVHALVQFGAIDPLCHVLGLRDDAEDGIVHVALGALDKILRHGQAMRVEQNLEENPYCLDVEKAGGLDQLEKLQVSRSNNIYAKAVNLITTHFPPLDEDDPIMSEAQNMQFGQAAVPAGGFRF